MLERPRYSVIVPVYNAQRTLHRCIESLLAQNYPNMELILVNDGSTDESGHICSEYQMHCDAVVYIDKPNGGVSSARNAGLECAKGEYILFVDSDDSVSSDYFTELDRAHENKPYDLLVFKKHGSGGKYADETPWFDALSSKASYIDQVVYMMHCRIIMQPVNKCYKRSIIQEHSLRFPEGVHTGEDFTFVMSYIVKCSSIKTICADLYCIDLSDQSSLTRRYRPALRDQLCSVYNEISNIVEHSNLSSANKEDILTAADYLYIKLVFSCIAEEFKAKPLHYFRDRKKIISICKSFETPISNGYCNAIHFTLRLLLKYRIYWPFYTVAYWAKGRKYNKTK